MTKALHGFRNASRTCVVPNPGSSYVWISDQLLEDTFRAFSYGQRRHESNVPGPLEAHRRAAKRRATHLAHHKPANRILDVSHNLNSRAVSRWWNEPEIDENALPKSSWWSFGLPYKPPPLPEPVTTIKHPSHDLEVLEKLQEPIKQEYLESIQHIRTFDELLHSLEKHSIDLIHNPGFACDILRHVLSIGWTAPEVEKFLLDPTLNPPGSTCHLHIFQQGAARPSVVRTLITRRIICQAIRLGLVELSTISMLPPAFLDCARTALLDRMDPHKYCLEVFAAVEESGLFQADPFDPSGVQSSIEIITSGRLYAHTPQLLWLLRTRIPDNDDGRSATLAQIIHDCLQMAENSTLHHVKHLVPFIVYKPRSIVNGAIMHLTMSLMNAGDSTPSHPLIDYAGRRDDIAKKTGLKNFDVPWVSTSIYNPLSTEQIKKFADIEPTLFELWYVILGAVGSFKDPKFILSPETLFEFVKSGTTIDDAGKRTIAGLWITMALAVNDDTSLRTITLAEVGKAMHDVFTQWSDGRSTNLLGWLIVNLRKSPLPAKNKLIRRLGSLTDGVINVNRTYWELNQYLIDLERLNFNVLIDARSYTSVRRYFNTEATALSESMNTDLASFEEGCINLIQNVPGQIPLVLRLLFGNMELKFALWQATSYRTPDTSDWRPDKSEEASKEALGGYDYTQIVEMVNNLSWATANSEHLSLRNRFRYTYWLTMYLHMHRAPVTQRTLDILCHAGIDAAPNHSYFVVNMIYSYLVEYRGHAYATERMQQSSRMSKILQDVQAKYTSDLSSWSEAQELDASMRKSEDSASEITAVQQQATTSEIVYQPFVDIPAPSQSTGYESDIRAWAQDPEFDTSVPKSENSTSEVGANQRRTVAHDSRQEKEAVYQPFMANPSLNEVVHSASKAIEDQSQGEAYQQQSGTDTSIQETGVVYQPFSEDPTPNQVVDTALLEEGAVEQIEPLAPVQQVHAATRNDGTQKSGIIYQPFVGSPALDEEATVIEDGKPIKGGESEDPIDHAFWSMK